MNRPFAVNPVSGVIPVDEMLQVSVEFQPVTVGEHVGEMIVHYDSGRSALYVQSLSVMNSLGICSSCFVFKTFQIC